MNIILDSLVLALAARTGNRSGIYRYTTELIRALKPYSDIKLALACSDILQTPWAWKEAASLDCNGQMEILSWDQYFQQINSRNARGNSDQFGRRRFVASGLAALTSQKYPAIRMLTSRVSALAFEQQRSRSQTSIIHSPFHLLAEELKTIRRTRLVRTIHDVLPIRMPQFFVKKSVTRFRDALASIGKDENILCISHTTKEDLLRLQPNIRADQVYVTPLAGSLPSQYNADEEDWQKFLKHFHIDQEEKLILTVGTIEPRKNLIGLVKSLEYLKNSAPDLRMRLLVVGHRGWNDQKIIHRIAQSCCHEQILLLGSLPDPLVSCLYQRADLCAFVSWGEGFGLPMLEAMQWGTPVIASSIPSLQEIAGDSAVYVDPSSAPDIAEGIRLILEDHALNQQLRLSGHKRAQRFSWESTAALTVNAYTKVLSL